MRGLKNSKFLRPSKVEGLSLSPTGEHRLQSDVTACTVRCMCETVCFHTSYIAAPLCLSSMPTAPHPSPLPGSQTANLCSCRPTRRATCFSPPSPSVARQPAVSAPLPSLKAHLAGGLDAISAVQVARAWEYQEFSKLAQFVGAWSGCAQFVGAWSGCAHVTSSLLSVPPLHAQATACSAACARADCIPAV